MVGRAHVTACAFALFMINVCEWLFSEDVISVANIVAVVGNAVIQR